MQPDQTPGSARKRNKVRSVWISFAGRIAAQLIGSIATVTLGVLVLGKGQVGKPAADNAVRPNPTVLIATPVRTHGETVIVMLPVDKNGKVDEALASGIAESYEKTKATASLNEVLANAARQTPTDQHARLSADRSADTRETLESPRE
jgi:hypothetical protein